MGEERRVTPEEAEGLEELSAELYGTMPGTRPPYDVEEMRSFFELSTDLLAITGFDGYFRLLNPSWEATLGYTRNELRMQPFIDFVHPDDRGATSTVAARLQQGARLISFQNRYRAKDGTYRALSWRATVSVEKKRYYTVTRDVTERREWNETASVLAAVLETAGDAILVQTVDGTISRWSAGAERLYGYSAAEAIGKPTAILIPPGRAGEIAGLFDGSNADAPDRVETVLLGKDGREVRVSLAVSPIGDGSGHITGAVAIAHPR